MGTPRFASAVPNMNQGPEYIERERKIDLKLGQDSSVVIDQILAAAAAAGCPPVNYSALLLTGAPSLLQPLSGASCCWCSGASSTLHWCRSHQHAPPAHLPMSQNTFCIVALSKPSETSTYQLQQQQQQQQQEKQVCVNTFSSLLV